MTKELPKVSTQLFIDGQWVDGSKGKHDVINPATGEVLTQISVGGKKETDQAIQAAKAAFQDWSVLAPTKRAEYMNKIADLIEEHVDDLAKIMTLEQGKPLQEAAGEIQSDVENFRWNAAEAQRIYGEIIPSPDDHHWLVAKQPVGVVAAITPWNFPSNMIARKIAPALAAGCTIVMKPSEDTPLSALALVDIFKQAELPNGVVNIVLGASKEIGEAMTESNEVKKLTFTGSTEVGKLLYEQSAPTLKKVSLELGGHAPFIVFKDADLELAADSLISAKFRNNGQVCTSPNRIFLHQEIKEKFTKMLEDRIKKVTYGNGLDNPTIGPLIREDAIEKIEKQLKDATEKGAKVLHGGKRPTDDKHKNGFFFEPTLLDNVDNSMDIFYKETFGPVIPLISFSDTDEVIAAANDTEFGLASYFFSNNLETISQVSKSLAYGMVGVNEMAISNSAVPFGGVKHSGFGRENSHYGPSEYVDVKFINIKAK